MDKKWVHPGGKLRELGPKSLTEAELLAILISTGIKNKSALQIAEEIISKFGNLGKLSSVPLSEFLRIKGLSDVKIIRIAATYEIAVRLKNKYENIKTI